MKRDFARQTPVRNLGNEISGEIFEIKADLIRLQTEARAVKDWKKELACLDRRVRLVECLLRDVRERQTNILAVNFDVPPEIAEKMAVAFLAKQRLLKENGDVDAA